ncbi:MAG: hypothetical protein ACREFF_07840 [Candidatus Udaeobacter sp.]
MRSLLYNLLIVAITLTLFGAASRVLRQPPKIQPLIDLETGETFPVLDAATVEQLGKWRFKPGTSSYVMPVQVVPPPPNHQSSRWVKTAS